MSKETPISKYLATLERRQARMNSIFGIATGSPSPNSSPSPNARGSLNIRQRLRFEDETFLQPNDEPMSRPGMSGLLRSSSGSNLAANFRDLVDKNDNGDSQRGGIKRKRFSFENSFREEEETAKKITELEKILRQTQAELIESRALTTKLEQQKMELSRNSAEKIIQFERSYNEMRSKTRDALEMAEELKSKLDKKIKELEEKSEKYHKDVSDRAEKVANLENKVIELESENLELKQKLEEEKVGQNQALNKSTLDLEETEKGAEKWIMDCQVLQGQLELKDQLLAKCQEELKEAQSLIYKNPKPTADETDSEVNGSEETPTPNTDASERVRTLENMFAKQQVENSKLSEAVAKLSKENSLMKSSMKKEMVLEEELVAMENEVKLLRDLLKKKADAEMTRDSLKDQLESWISVASKINQDCANPQNLETFIRQTQNSLLEIKHENASMILKLSNTNALLKACQDDLTSSKNQVKLAEEERSNISAELKQTSRKLMLVTKDRDGLKCLKESYEQEFENVISSGLSKRISQLEELVKEYEVIVNEDPTAKKSCRECETRMKLISDLRHELDKLKTEKESQFMDSTFGDGSANTTGVKVVTFGMNPSTLTLEGRIQELIAENKKLTERIKQLEDQSVGGLGDSFMIEEKTKLEKELAEVNRKYDALKEDYNFELHQNQVVMTKLFGFNVTFVKDATAQIRLQSIYSPNVEDFFVFQENENEMMLMETAVLAQYREEIDKYLVTEGSIPAFLSYITMSLASGLASENSEVAEPTNPINPDESFEETTNTVSVQPAGRRTVQVEIEGESDNDDGSEGDPEDDPEEAEEEEEYDDDDREDYSEDSGGESEDEREDKRGGSKGRDSDSDDVVCIDSD